MAVVVVRLPARPLAKITIRPYLRHSLHLNYMSGFLCWTTGNCNGWTHIYNYVMHILQRFLRFQSDFERQRSSLVVTIQVEFPASISRSPFNVPHSAANWISNSWSCCSNGVHSQFHYFVVSRPRCYQW